MKQEFLREHPQYAQWRGLDAEEREVAKANAKEKFAALDPAEQARLKEKAKAGKEKYDVVIEAKKEEVVENIEEGKEAWDNMSDEEKAAKKKEVGMEKFMEFMIESIVMNIIQKSQEDNKKVIEAMRKYRENQG